MRATYFFISSYVLKSLGLVDYEEIDLYISITTGEIIRCTKLFPSDLIEFNLGDLDEILGMN